MVIFVDPGVANPEPPEVIVSPDGVLTATVHESGGGVLLQADFRPEWTPGTPGRPEQVLRTNLSLSPRNAGGVWKRGVSTYMVEETSLPSSPPGTNLTTGAKCTRTGAGGSTTAATLYDCDGRGSSTMPRRMGVWVCPTIPDCQAQIGTTGPFVDTPADQWTWVTGTEALTGTAAGTVRVYKKPGSGEAPQGTVVYVTGSHVTTDEDVPEPVAATFVNPYAGVGFGAVQHLPGVTHMHAATQAEIDDFAAAGVRIMACSRYYPEQPVPPSEYTSLPEGVTVYLPNSEQHSCTDSNLHFCPIGSDYANDGGTGVPWRDAFDAAIAALRYPDAGGVILNHLSWSSSVSEATWLAMLDHDPRVIGIEVYNHGTVEGIQAPPRNSTDYARWDRYLASGRHLWGYWAHDHYQPEKAPYRGFNMLLMPEETEYQALKAYRDGRFYGSMTQQLRLTGLTLNGRDVTISTDAADEVRMITNLGVETKAGATATFTIPAGAVYARFEGENADDTIYTQPILSEVADDTETGATGFFDGDSAQNGDRRYRWTGTPGASTSEEYLSAVDPVPPGEPEGDAPAWVRIERDGQPIMSGNPAAAPGGYGVAYDMFAPLGVPVTYRAVPIFYDGTEGTPSEAVAVVLPAPGGVRDAWLKSSRNPGLSMRVQIIEPLPEFVYKSRLNLQEVPNSRYPAGAQDAHLAMETALTILSDTKGERARLFELLQAGPLLFQTHPDNDIADAWVVVGDIGMALMPSGVHDEHKEFEVPLTEVAQPSTADTPLIIPGRSWQWATDTHTWNSLNATFDSWLSVVTPQ